MSRLFIYLSRYGFLFYILFFLWQSLLAIRDARPENGGNAARPLFAQRVIILVMHYTGILILSYQEGTLQFTPSALVLGGAGLAFLLAGFFVTDHVYRHSDGLLWNCLFFLLDLSLIMLLRLNPALAQKQLLWMALGMAAALVLPLPLNLFPQLQNWKYLYLGLSLLLALATLLLGNEAYGSVSWLTLGLLQFQPSEVIKFLFLFYLASEFREGWDRRRILVSGGFAAALVLLLVCQKDLGAGLLFFMMYLTLLYIATGRTLLFLAGLGAGAGASLLAYKLFAHVRVRVAAWRDPWADVDSGGYQIAQSLFAICSGGFFGSGLGLGMPKSIPVVEKDFIFAAICEELGGLFALGLLAVFLTLFLRGMHIALRAESRFYSLIAAGVVCLLAFQTFLIVGGNLKLIPLTGVTLPFVSYGGSSIFVSLLMVGLLQWVGAHHRAGTEEAEREAHLLSHKKPAKKSGQRPRKATARALAKTGATPKATAKKAVAPKSSASKEGRNHEK